MRCLLTHEISLPYFRQVVKGGIGGKNERMYSIYFILFSKQGTHIPQTDFCHAIVQPD